MGLTWFKTYANWIEQIEFLADEEVGRLFRALLQFSNGDDICPMVGNERFVFTGLRQSVERDLENLNNKSNAGTQSGNARGAASCSNTKKSVRTENNVFEQENSCSNTNEICSGRKEDKKIRQPDDKKNRGGEEERIRTSEEEKNRTPYTPQADADQPNADGPPSAAGFPILNEFDLVLQNALREWLSYKYKKKKPGQIVLDNLCKQVRETVSMYGSEATAQAISQSIANEYKGIVWDLAKNAQKKQSSQSSNPWGDWSEEDYLKDANNDFIPPGFDE